MKPAPSETTAELLHRVRQQLILAQVRIMELEDARDELAPKLSEAGQLLDAAQTLADQKMDEAGHLAKVRTDLQAQYEHMRHMQHVTNEALNDTRRQLADTTKQLVAAEQRTGQLQQEIVTLAEQASELTQNISRLGLEVVELNSTATVRLARIEVLEAELRTVKGSRSWRWTSWLRSLERAFAGRKQ